MEAEALLASGIRERGKIVFYLAELDRIYEQFLNEMLPLPDPGLKARALFTWLWTSKPTRYKPHGSYKLSEVIEAQLKQEAKSVGNCLGLTLLYNCLLRRMNIYAEALYLENAFATGPHVLTLLQIENSLIDIENIIPDGFDYKGHVRNPSRQRWGERELVADIYHSLGNDDFDRAEYEGALRSYEMAIRLNPHYETARLNRTILLDRIGHHGVVCEQ